MRRRNVYGAVIVLGVAGLFGAYVAASTDHTIRVAAPTIQTRIDRVLPKTTHGITVTRAILSFEDSRAIINVEVNGKKLTRKFHLSARAIGVPDFVHSRNGDFYFKPEKVDVVEFAFEGDPPSKFLVRAADRYGMKHPGLQNALIDIAPHVEEWISEAAHQGAILALEHIPVYRLKDDNVGAFLQASLQDVRIDGDHLVVQFSLKQFTIAAMGIVGSVILVVAVMVVLL